MILARHTAFNLIGLGAPLGVALLTIPALLAGLGAERFGLLLLVWAATSYFGLFDLGMGRALTQALAQMLQAGGQRNQVAPLTRTALGLMLLLGALGGLLLATFAPNLVPANTPPPAAQEMRQALLWMALALPLITTSAGQRGVLEACGAFAALNLIRLPLGVWTYLCPWIAMRIWGPDLAAITALLALGRLLGWVAQALAVRRALPEARVVGPWSARWLRQLLRAGGWMTVSNVISPLMGYLDRFVIAALLSASAVAYYATPYEIVTKLWIVPGALVGVLLPRFAAQGLADWPLHGRAVEALYWVLLPVCAALALFAHPLLSLWIGTDFATQSAALLQGFAMGILVNCLAHVPLTWLHAHASYRAPALLHLLELPLFAGLLLLLVPGWGLQGALLAWGLRIGLDTLGMFWLAARVAVQPLPRPGLAVLPFALVLLPLAWPPAERPILPTALVLLLVMTMAALRLTSLRRRMSPP